MIEEVRAILAGIKAAFGSMDDLDLVVLFRQRGVVMKSVPGAAGASHHNPRTPNVHISGPHHFKHHQKSTRRHPEREKKRKWEREREKQREMLGSPTLRGPIFLGFGAQPFVLLFFFEKEGQKTEPPIWAEVGLAKVG